MFRSSWGWSSRFRARLAALVAVGACLTVATTASAAVQTISDGSDFVEGGDGGSQVSTDFRSVTWDSTAQPGKVLLSIALDSLPNARISSAVYIDVTSDAKADYAIDITPNGVNPSQHPDFASMAAAKYRLRRVLTSTTQCQSYDDTSTDSPFSYISVPTSFSASGGAGLTTFTIPIDLASIGNPASFTWAIIGQTQPAGPQLYDLVPDAANGVPGQDPARGSRGEADDWFCSPAGDGLSAGYRVDMTRGISFPPPAAPSASPPAFDKPPHDQAISQSPRLARPNQPVDFTASAVDDDGAIVNYAWDLDGDGFFNDAAGARISRTFTAVGTYPVGVRMTDNGGNVVFAYRSVDVAQRPTSFSISASKSNPIKSEKVTFTANFDSDATINDADIQWGIDFPNNNVELPFDKFTGRTWTLGFGAPGPYIIKARVTDSTGKLSIASIDVNVVNQPPKFREIRVRAKKVPDQPFNKDPLVKGEPVILEALLTDDNLRRPRVEWDLDGNGIYDDAVGEKIEQTYRDAGEQKAAVRIVDEGGLTAFGDNTFEIRDSAEAECAGKAGDQGIRAVGCFSKDPSVPNDPTARMTKEPFKLDGLEVTPKDGAVVHIINRGLLYTTGPGTVEVRTGSIVLFEGRFKMEADCRPAQQECLVGRFKSPALANLKGFPIQGDVDVLFTPEGTKVKVNVDVLGSIGLGVTGRADLIVNDKTGLKLNSLEIRSPMIPLGKLNIGQFYVTYDGKARLWEGGGNVTLPTPQFTKLIGDFAFSELTGFQRAHGEVDGLNIPIDEFGTVYLQRIAFTIEIKGFDSGNPRVRLGGGLGISAGPRVAGVDIATIDGDFLFTFGNPVGVDVEGRISIAGFDVMGGTLSARTNGDAAFKGFIGFGLPFPSAYKGVRKDATKLKVSRFSSSGADVFNPITQLVSVKGEADAWVEPNAFNLEASISAKVIGITLAKATGLMSSKAIAGCGEIVGIKSGFGYYYDSQKTDLFGNSCDLAPYRPVRQFAPLDDNGSGRLPGARAAGARQAPAPADGAPGATAIDVAADQKALVMKLDGAGGDPIVNLVGPDGKSYAMSATDPATQSADFFAARNPQGDESYVGVRAPKPGRWQIVPQPGSVAITGVSGAPVLPDPDVKATVKGTGDKRTIDYEIKPIGGQTVSFVEQGDDTHRTVGVADGPRGSITFTPQDGADQSRKLIAIVVQNGTDRAHIPVAAFTAPPLRRPATPTRLRARRGAGGRVTLAFNRVPGAREYRVIAHIAGGRTLFFPTRKQRLVVANIGRRRSVRFDVRAVDNNARSSKVAKLRLKQGRRRAG